MQDLSSQEPRFQSPSLDVVFKPRTIAVIGATDREGSVGRTVLLNLNVPASPAKIFAVNPKRAEVLGVPSYPSIGKVPEHVDLAVIVTPAAAWPEGSGGTK